MSLWGHWKSFWLGLDYAASETVTEKPNVTISSRIAMARNDGKWWGVWGCRALNVMFMTKDHCAGALIHDKERAEQALKELQDEQAEHNYDRGGSVGSPDGSSGVDLGSVPASPPHPD